MNNNPFGDASDRGLLPNRAVAPNADMIYRVRLAKTFRINVPGYTAGIAYGHILSPSLKDNGVFIEASVGMSANVDLKSSNWKNRLVSGFSAAPSPAITLEYGRPQVSLITTSFSAKIAAPSIVFSPPNADGEYSVQISRSVSVGIRQEFVLRLAVTARTLEDTISDFLEMSEHVYNDALRDLNVPDGERTWNDSFQP